MQGAGFPLYLLDYIQVQKDAVSIPNPGLMVSSYKMDPLLNLYLFKNGLNSFMCCFFNLVNKF